MSRASVLPRLQKSSGFTIIEVMIVLAIAALILLIILLVVPTAQRNARNYDRKHYTSLVMASMLTAYNDLGHYPGESGSINSDPAKTEVCTFLRSLPNVRPSAPCAYSTADYNSVNGDVAEACLTVQAGPYTICYMDTELINHGYIGPPDEIVVVPMHWCNAGANQDPSEPATYPIAGDDSPLHRFAVWTLLEGMNTPLCLDSAPGTMP